MPDLAVAVNSRGTDHPTAEPLAAASRFGQRGQVLIIFAGALIALMMLMAMVVDIGWYWSNGLKIQRAADAAALAGAVYLPDAGDKVALGKANTAALAAAARNGYVPSATTTVTTAIDDNNPRQLDVAITDKVGTFFLKVAGIQTLNAGRSSKAEFVLPVPMGSPQNYYGIGTFFGLNIPAPVVTTYVNPSNYTTANQTNGVSPSANSQVGNNWSGLDNAYASDANYATTTTNGSQAVWKGFTFATNAFASGAIIDGVIVSIQANRAPSGKACQIKAEVSWDGGLTWGDSPETSNNLTASDAWDQLGSSTDLTVWGISSGGAWSTADFTTANNFQVRLTFLKGTCTTLSVNEITVAVYSHTSVQGPSVEASRTVNSPTGGALQPQNFWGADITLGGDRGNGDQFGPAKDGGSTNPNFDGKGVDYTVVIAGSGGEVWLYDPTFCETGQNSGGASYGAGDHWIAGNPNPVTTDYVLWWEKNTPYDPSDDVQMATSGTTFDNRAEADYSAAMGADKDKSGNVMHPGLINCAADPYHDNWYRLASGLPAGTYRLNVTTNVEGNTGTNAENMWGAWVTSSTAGSRFYGEGKMVTYTNLIKGTTLFYLAQIDKVHAGKTMEIKLFDPGDVGGGAWLRVMSPDGNVYTPATFTYSADAKASPPHGDKTTGTCIQTNGGSTAGLTPPAGCTNLTSGGNFYQDSLITILIPLPTTYGSVGLTPSTESATGPGWWKIEYTVGNGNDTTTWQVDIQGNPVHLLVP